MKTYANGFFPNIAEPLDIHFTGSAVRICRLQEGNISVICVCPPATFQWRPVRKDNPGRTSQEGGRVRGMGVVYLCLRGFTVVYLIAEVLLDFVKS